MVSRIINYLFKHYKNKTLMLLIGLMLGALSVPLKSIFQYTLSFSNLLFMVLFLILGVIIVSVIDLFRV